MDQRLVCRCGDQEQLTRLLRGCGWQPLTFESAAQLRAHNDAQQLRCSNGVGEMGLEVLPPWLFASGQTSGLWRASNVSRRGVAPPDLVTFHPNFGGFAGGSKKAMLRRLRLHEDASSRGARTGWCLDSASGSRAG